MKTMPDMTEVDRAPEHDPRRWGTRAMVCCVIAFVLFIVGMVVVTIRGQRDGADLSPSTELTLPRPVPRTPAPPLATGTAEPDWLEMAQSIATYDAWLRANPDPEVVQRYMHPTNPGYAEAVDGYRRLASGEWRYAPPPEAIVVQSVRVMAADRSSVRLFVWLGPTPRYHVVDREGHNVHDEPAGPASAVAWVLRYDDGLWRLARVEPV